VKGVTRPVSHVVYKLVLLHHDVWILPALCVPEVGVLDVDYATRRADVISELVVKEDNGTLVTLNHERGYVFESGNHQIVVPFFVRVDYLLQEVAGCPEVVHADLKLHVLAS